MNDQCIDHGQCVGDPRAYGKVWCDGVTRQAHRVIYAKEYGIDERTMEGVVMHLCDNPRCVNPLHLRLGTQSDNLQDRIVGIQDGFE